MDRGPVGDSGPVVYWESIVQWGPVVDWGPVGEQPVTMKKVLNAILQNLPVISN